jgi:hypothetical protein
LDLCKIVELYSLSPLEETRCLDSLLSEKLLDFFVVAGIDNMRNKTTLCVFVEVPGAAQALALGSFVEVG